MDMSKLAHRELPPPIPVMVDPDVTRMREGMEALADLKLRTGVGPTIPMPPAVGLYSHPEELEFVRQLLRADRAAEALELVDRMLVTRSHRGG